MNHQWIRRWSALPLAAFAWAYVCPAAGPGENLHPAAAVRMTGPDPAAAPASSGGRIDPDRPAGAGGATADPTLDRTRPAALEVTAPPRAALAPALLTPIPDPLRRPGDVGLPDRPDDDPPVPSPGRPARPVLPVKP